MEWNDLAKSELASMLNAGKLDHPTNAKFSPAAWQSALEAIPAPTERDRALTVAAIYFGRELASLRKYKIPQVTQGLGRTRLVRLLVSYANQQYLLLQSKVTAKLKEMKRAGEAFDPERNQQILIPNVGGQEMTPDDMITVQVDSLPHWLFHIWNVQDGVTDTDVANTDSFAGNAMITSSLEHALRQMWLTALWCGDQIIEKAGKLVKTPGERALAEHWFIWDLRQNMLFGAEHHFDAGHRIVTGGKLPPVVPVNERTVVRMGRTQSGQSRFFTGKAIGAKVEQRSHVNECILLEKQYTGLFLDEPLPLSPGQSFTCRELSRAWWVLQDLARVAIADLSRQPDKKTEVRHALTLEKSNIAAMLEDCLSIDANRANHIVDWLTCDPNNTARLFSKSFWSEPLVPEPGSARLHVLLSPLLEGSPVKRVEAWMEKGGISDNKGIKGRGKPFENHVRRELIAAVEDNALLSDTQVALHGLKRKGTSEEIDLLVRIGNAVIIGEVKCFVAPSEPLEKYNHLRNLSLATDQANSKRAWAEANREVIGRVLGITDAKQVAALKMYPVVVLNHGLGIGLERNGVPVVDLQYLRLLFETGSYRSGARFERGRGIIFANTHLYTSQTDLEERLGLLLAEPIVLKRFEDILRWREAPILTSDGQPFVIELPALSEVPPPNVLRDIPFPGIPPRQDTRKGR